MTEGFEGFEGVVSCCIHKDLIYATLAQQCVGVIDLTGRCLRTWGRKGFAPGQFHGIAGIAAAEDGTLFVLDLGRVQLFRREMPVHAFEVSDRQAGGRLCWHGDRLYHASRAGVCVYSRTGDLMGALVSALEFDARRAVDIVVTTEEISLRTRCLVSTGSRFGPLVITPTCDEWTCQDSENTSPACV